jgi:hypothetical protein
MDNETLTLLLKGGHLNMEERIKRGVWPHPPLRYSDVREHLISIIEKEEWFPCDLSHGRGGIVIQNAGDRYICHSLQYDAFGAPIVSDRQQKVFATAKDAADFYLKWDLHLPGDMDSWQVV